MPEKKKNILSSISYVMIITVLSRILSLVSTQVYMSFFGVSDVYLNVYSYAITVPNTIFNCFGTAISAVIIPIYAGHIANGREEDAKRFSNNIITVISAFTAVLVILGWAASFVLPKFTVFNSGEEYSFAVKALMIIMPVMIFYGLNYIFQGILQSHGKYGWPAFVTVPSSLAVIIYVFTLADKFGVFGLLIATFIGLSLQAVILIPPLIAGGFRYRPVFCLKDPDMLLVFKRMLPVLIGVSSYQLNMFYNVTMIANFDGMVTLITYVQNLVLQMILALVYAIIAVVYPTLTQFAATGDNENYKKTISDTVASTSMILIPLTFGFIALRKPLLKLIAQWGQVTEADIDVACILLILYSIGIMGVGLKEILDRAFYASGNTKTPAINGFVIMAANIILSLAFIKLLESFNILGAFGIPLAYSVSSLIGLFNLIIKLKKKIGSYSKGFYLNLLCSLAGAVIMFFLVALTDSFVAIKISDTGLLSRIIRLIIPAGVGIVSYFVLLLILKMPYMTELVSSFKRKIKKSN